MPCTHTPAKSHNFLGGILKKVSFFFSKIFEHAVHCMLYNHFQENKLLSPLQSGFRPHHSTLTCFTHVTITLLTNIEKGLLTGLMFLDISKGFDTLEHNIMLNKLLFIGLNHSAIQWFRSYMQACST